MTYSIYSISSRTYCTVHHSAADMSLEHTVYTVYHSAADMSLEHTVLYIILQQTCL